MFFFEQIIRMARSRGGTKGFTTPEVIVATGIGVVLSVAVTASLVGIVGLVSNAERNVTRNVLPTSVSNQITSHIEAAEILVPLNASTNGNDKLSLYSNANVDMIVSPKSRVCEYHSYFLKPISTSLRTAQLRHFVKSFSFTADIASALTLNDTSSCLTYYKYIVENSIGDATKGANICLAYTTTQMIATPAVNNVAGERCEMLLPSVLVVNPLFTYLNNGGEVLPQTQNTANTTYLAYSTGSGLASTGVFAAGVGNKCMLDPTIAGEVTATNNWYAPGSNLSTVRVQVVLPRGEGGTATTSEVYDNYATPQYVALGSLAC